MGTGVGGFPMDRAAKVMVEEARRAAEAGGSVERVVFVLRDEASRVVFAAELKQSR